MYSIQAAITGAIQGLSEFLPISSSAHIVFSNELYSILTHTKTLESINQEEIFFDIIVHLATLFAVIIYFFKDIKNILYGFFKAVKEKNFKNNDFKLTGYIAISTIITGIIGLCLKEKIENIINNPQAICILLFFTGIILLLSEKAYKGNRKISLKRAVIISIAQGLAIFPGFSRSGLTISTALFLGMGRIESARFSFLMSIPIIILASVAYPVIELDFRQIMTFNLKAIIIGFLTSFFAGYLCIKYFMRLLGRFGLKCFGYYCLLISFAMFFVFQFCYRL